MCHTHAAREILLPVSIISFIAHLLLRRVTRVASPFTVLSQLLLGKKKELSPTAVRSLA
jgi:hypothetical protein